MAQNNWYKRIVAQFNAKILPQALSDKVVSPNVTANDEAVEMTLSDDSLKDLLALADNSDCAPDACEKQRLLENYLQSKTTVAGMTLDELIHNVPNARYTVDQIVSFIFRNKMVAKRNGKLDTEETDQITRFLEQKSPDGVTNEAKIHSAVANSMLYGRWGLYRNDQGVLEEYAYNQYTVVIGYTKTNHRVQPTLYGYILSAEPVDQAVLNITDVPEGVNISWFKENLTQNLNPVYHPDRDVIRQVFIPVASKRFVNLRYDIDCYNPESRLYFERLRLEDSIYLHKALTRKFKETGIGQLIVEVNKESVRLDNNSEDAITNLINPTQNAKHNWVERLKNYYKLLSNALANKLEGVFIIPEGLTFKERVHNTNTPERFLKILQTDEVVIPMAYGIPPTLLGLGTLSDRNISIANVNQTSEDTIVAQIRENYFSQLSEIIGVEGVITDVPAEAIEDTLNHTEQLAKIIEMLYKADRFAQVEELIAKYSDYFEEDLDL